MRCTGADAVARGTVPRCGDDAPVAGQTQIVIAAEVEHLAVIDPQPRTLSRIDDATLAPKTPRRPSVRSASSSSRSTATLSAGI